MMAERVEDSELFREAAAEWRRRRDKAERKAHQAPSGVAQPLPLAASSAVLYADMPVPERQFLDEAGLMPARNVVLLSGDGGAGKSLLALQLALAVATGAAWIGITVHAGAALYVSAEDDSQEVHIRLAQIAEAEGIDLADAGALNFIYMAGEDAVLAAEQSKSGRLQPTQLFGRLDATLDLIRPALLVLDNLADVFAGNENNRSLAKHFVGLLRRLAIRYDCVVLLLGHPSLAGLASGTGTSGSTAWNNSARSRLYLHRDADASGHEPDQAVRILECMKSNYAPRAAPIGLKWQDGRFLRKDPPRPFDNVNVDHLETVQAAFQRGNYRSSEQSPEWGGHVVASVLDLDIGQGIGPADRTGAQAAARARVRKILATWVTNKAIRIVLEPDEHRKNRGVYRA